MSKRKKALTIYAIVIFIILIAILFIIPDSVFLKLYPSKIPPMSGETSEETKKEFTDYEEQKERLLNKEFDYEYVLLDSMNKKSYIYKCSGSVNKEKDNGFCTSHTSINRMDDEAPSKDKTTAITYNEKNKKEELKIDTLYLDPEFIFILLDDVKYKETKNQTFRDFTYKTKIKDLNTEIIVYTNLDNITKIEINNQYMNYILKFSNIKY